MKLQALAAVVAGATLAHVNASPIRVVVVTGTQDRHPVQHLHFGYGAADSHAAKVASLAPPAKFDLVHPHSSGRLPCGKFVKDKAIGLSNTFRQALGLPLIEAATPKPGDQMHGGMIHILPFIGTPPMFAEPANGGAEIHRRPGHHQFHHHHHKFHGGNNFWMRIHNALMALGPWEGRAVAFVFGCGLGVLLRMFWVLVVVTYRSVRESGRDEYTQIAVIQEYVDAEDIVVPPPSYTTLNEKDEVKVKDGAEN